MPPEKLSIVHLNTNESRGGAAKVAWRLVQAQNTAGHRARILVSNKEGAAPEVEAFAAEPDASLAAECEREGWLDYQFQGSHRLCRHPIVEAADLLHLHNLHGGYFNPFSLLPLTRRKPTVWTLHDMQAFTGHCAHSFDCERWQSGCGECPDLETYPPLRHDSTAQLWRDKRWLYAGSDFWIVTPSQWLRSKVERSVLKNHRIEHIPNGVDTGCFRPIDKSALRRQHQLPEDLLLIGCVANFGLTNIYKGGRYSGEIMRAFHQEFPRARFLNIGSRDRSNEPWMIDVPHVDDEAQLAELYSLLDVFLYTPIADNCPLVILEALACGVPIISFVTGGVPELVRDRQDGFTVPAKDTSAALQALRVLANDSGRRREFAGNARRRAVETFDHRLIAQRYERLYVGLLESRGNVAPKPLRLESVPSVIQTTAFLQAVSESIVQSGEPEARKAAAIKIEELRHAVAGAPSDPALRLHLCAALLDQGDCAAARPEFERALLLAPGSASAHAWGGLLHLRTGDVHAAVVALRHAQALDSSNADTLTLQEAVERASGAPTPRSHRICPDGVHPSPGAESRAASHATESSRARLSSAAAAPEDGRTPTRTQASRPLEDFVSVYLRKAEACLARGDGASAREELEFALDVEPNAVSLRLALGNVWLRENQSARARDQFARALAIDPNCAEAQAGLGLAQEHKKPPGEAASTAPGAPALSRNCSDGARETARLANFGGSGKSGVPLVSVIVSAYAAEKFIRACLEDLEAQTIAEQLEIIVIDSGSPENERAIVEEFQQRHSNITYHRTDRETLYAAWNRAIQLARGKYIANANCDDAHRPDALELLAAALEAHPEADLAYGDYYTTTVPNDSFANPTILRHVTHPPFHPATVMMYCVTGCHPMWRRTVFDKIGLFDPTYTAPGDWEFLCRFVQAGLRAVHVPRPLSLFYQNAEGLSFKSVAQSKKESDRILNQYRHQMPIERLFRVDPEDPRSVARGWVALGNMAAQHDVPWFTNRVQDLDYAMTCYQRALGADPANVAAARNLAATGVLRRQIFDEAPGFQHLPADQAAALQRGIDGGQLPLEAVEVPPAAEPITFGSIGASAGPRATHVPPPAPLANAALKLPIRFAGAFLEGGDAAADAANLAVLLASRVNLGTVDQSDPKSASREEQLPAPARAALAETRSRFGFCLGGVGISHGVGDELKHIRGSVFHIGRTTFEADRLPLKWVTVCNQMDELWVPSRSQAEAFAAGGVEREKLVVIPGAVDADAFDPAKHEPMVLPNRASFNFLGLFGWRASKGWEVLLAAYLREFSVDDDVCLYLCASAPRMAEAQSRTMIEREIHDFTKALHLGDKKRPRIELLAAPTAAADAPELYRAMDCVVAPSRGEGWARAVQEAMMMARPVIATDWGAAADWLSAETCYPLDYELVPAGNLELDEWHCHGARWANPSEQHLRELMRRVQRNPAEARAKGARAREFAKQQFSGERVADLMLARLRALEEKATQPSCPRHVARPAALPAVSGAESADRPPSIGVALEGSFLDFGSLSHVNRELSRQLAKQPNLSLACVGRNVLSPELARQSVLRETARRLTYPAPGNTGITIRHAWPPNWERPASGKWVLIQPWEFGVLPREWAERVGAVDEIWAPSEYVRRVYVESGVDPRKVFVVPNGIDPEQFRPDAAPMALATRKQFKFLFVGGTIHRKGPDLLLKAYLDQFTCADDVCLVVKDFGGQSVYAGQTFEQQIRAAQSRPGAPEIVYLNEELPPEALPGLYTACDCLVHPYRGEGFGLPVLEAMACGLPVIVTGGGATDDFAIDEFAYRIPALRKNFGAKVGDLKLPRSGWLLEPDLGALGGRMRHVATNPAEAKSKGRAASEHVRREWTWERAARIAGHRLEALAARPTQPRPTPRRSSKPISLPSCAKVGHLGDARALFAQGSLEPAWDAALAALKARPFHPEAVLLLAGIALAAGDTKQAKELAERARQMAPKWKPAQQPLKPPPDKGAARIKLPALPDDMRNAQRSPRLSVCLITRNEERFLARCLESVRGLAWQIVVVDTGSTDQTRDIAARFGAEIYSFDWCDDFSAARNAALERAIGDWVLFLDADEELPADQRQKLAESLNDRTAIAFRLPMIDRGREDEGVSYVPRLYRNAPGLFYVGRVHEQVFSSVEVRRLEWGLDNKFGDATLLHYGYTKELVMSRDKVGRNLRLLQKALEELPGEPNLLMNLGLELVRAGRLSDGLEQYEAAFYALSALPSEEVAPELRETLLTQFATHLLAEKRHADVGRVLRSKLAGAGGLTATMHWLFGLACMETKNFAEGAEQMRQCLAKRSKPALSPVNKNILKAGPHHCLASCLAALKQTDAANKAFRAALQADPKSRAVQLDFARFLAENGREVEALQGLHQLVVAHPSDAALWQFGGRVALSQPQFLEFACDWTGEAIKLFPAHGGLAEQRAQALLLSGRIEEALPLWARLAAHGKAPHRAALLICLCALGRSLPIVPMELAQAVNQEFLAWYRRLLANNARQVIDVLHQRMDSLHQVVPLAVRVLRTAIAEAGAVPAE